MLSRGGKLEIAFIGVNRNSRHLKSWERLQTIEGQVLQENTTMLAMCKELGFEITSDPHDADLSIVRLVISEPHTNP